MKIVTKPILFKEFFKISSSEFVNLYFNMKIELARVELPNIEHLAIYVWIKLAAFHDFGNIDLKG